MLKDAECRNHDPEIWFAELTRGLGKHICLRHCPVFQECSEIAPSLRIQGGVIAGQYWRLASRNNKTPAISRSQPKEIICQACLERRIWNYARYGACVICNNDARKGSMFCRNKECRKTYYETINVHSVLEIKNME